MLRFKLVLSIALLMVVVAYAASSEEDESHSEEDASHSEEEEEEGCGGDINAYSRPCGDPCPTTCENRHEPLPRPCPTICIPDGCVCKKGYVLGRHGKCVSPSQCPRIQPLGCRGDPNAHVSGCGDPCPITCANMHFGGPRICRRICIINGCKCNPGYVLNRLGRCVLPHECDIQVCRGQNEVWSSCGTGCPPTCNNRHPFCNLLCHRGCFCKPGYIRSHKGGPCIRISDCDKQTCRGPHEVWNSCGTRCPPTCDNRNPGCTRECHPGCFCKPGYIRSYEGGDCIRVRDCDYEIRD